MTNIHYLPELEDSYSALNSDQIEILRQQVLNEGGEISSIQSRFNYAWGLVRSTNKEDQMLGVKLLTDTYKESPMRRRECLYYLTIGCYKLGEYSTAKRYVDALVHHEPENKQALMLQTAVENKITSQGLKGIALISAGIAIGATTIGLLIRGRRR